MNGKTWHVAIYVTMLEHGEAQTTATKVVSVANEMFPGDPLPAWLPAAEWELGQFRKHLAFLREPGTGPSPSLIRLLKWSLTGYGLRPKHPIVMRFREYLSCHDLKNPELRKMANVRTQPLSEEPRAAPGETRRVHSEGRRYADLVVAG